MVHARSFDDLAYPFTVEQLARLAMYRAAVRAGLYTDQVDEDLMPVEGCPWTGSSLATVRDVLSRFSAIESVWDAGGDSGGMD